MSDDTEAGGSCDYCDLPAVALLANDAPLGSADYAERRVCRWHQRNAFPSAEVAPPDVQAGGSASVPTTSEAGDAEVQRLRTLLDVRGDGTEFDIRTALHNHRAWTRQATDRAEAAEAEVRALRAKVERVEALVQQVRDLRWHHLGEDDYAWGMEEAKRQIVAILDTLDGDGS